MWVQIIDKTNRNLAGHFTAKLFPCVYVFVSKSNKDAKKFFGFGLADEVIK